MTLLKINYGMSSKKLNSCIHLSIVEYHHDKFKLNHLELFDSITPTKIQEMEKHVKMWDDLVELVKNVEGIDYIDQYVHHHQEFQNYCSSSNYYYRRNKINNILYKYLYDC